MPKLCEFCGQVPKLKKNPRRRFRLFYTVFIPHKSPTKRFKICYACFISGKGMHIFQPVKP